MIASFLFICLGLISYPLQFFRNISLKNKNDFTSLLQNKQIIYDSSLNGYENFITPFSGFLDIRSTSITVTVVYSMIIILITSAFCILYLVFVRRPCKKQEPDDIIDQALTTFA